MIGPWVDEDDLILNNLFLVIRFRGELKLVRINAKHAS